MATRNEVLAQLVTTGRQVMLASWAPDSCIAATRVGIDVLAHFGVEANAVSVGLLALNPVASAGYAAGLPANQWAQGAHLVNMAFTNPPGSPWNGHCLIVCGRDLVDTSLDQASRPQWNLQVQPAVFPLPDIPIDGNTQLSWAFQNQCRVVYRIRLDDTDYKESPGWTEDNLLAPVRQQIIAAMEAALG